jgi:hypothetical protein
VRGWSAPVRPSRRPLRERFSMRIFVECANWRHPESLTRNVLETLARRLSFVIPGHRAAVNPATVFLGLEGTLSRSMALRVRRSFRATAMRAVAVTGPAPGAERRSRAGIAPSYELLRSGIQRSPTRPTLPQTQYAGTHAHGQSPLWHRDPSQLGGCLCSWVPGSAPLVDPE